MAVQTNIQTLGHFDPLAESWRLHLEAENKSNKTLSNYMDATRQLSSFLGGSGMPMTVAAISREHVEAFLVAVRERTSAATAATRYRGLQQFFKWLLDEGEIPSNPMERMKPPKVETPLVPVILEDDLRALLKACQGREFEDRRDMAIIRTFLNTGARLAELAGVCLVDVDLRSREIVVLGKGAGRARCPSGRRP